MQYVLMYSFFVITIIKSAIQIKLIWIESNEMNTNKDFLFRNCKRNLRLCKKVKTMFASARVGEAWGFTDVDCLRGTLAKPTVKKTTTKKASRIDWTSPALTAEGAFGRKGGCLPMCQCLCQRECLSTCTGTCNGLGCDRYCLLVTDYSWSIKPRSISASL